MKKKYDDFSKSYYLLFIFFVLFVGMILFFWCHRLIIYKVYDGVLYEKDNILLILSDNELKLFNKNKRLFIKNKSCVFNISKIVDDSIERNGDKYNQVFIEVNLSNMYKVGDVVKITIMDDKKSLFRIFNVIWDGD